MTSCKLYNFKISSSVVHTVPYPVGTGFVPKERSSRSVRLSPFTRWFLDMKISEGVCMDPEGHPQKDITVIKCLLVPPNSENQTLTSNSFPSSVGSNFGGLRGPHTLPARIRDRDCLNFLRTHLGRQLETLPPSVRVFECGFQRRCSPHYSRNVRRWLSEKFPETLLWSSVFWPERWSDLCCRDFSSEDILSLCRTVCTREELWRWIQQFTNEMKNTSWIFERLRLLFHTFELCVREMEATLSISCKEAKMKTLLISLFFITSCTQPDVHRNMAGT
jgi:hypothetical protein